MSQIKKRTIKVSLEFGEGYPDCVSEIQMAGFGNDVAWRNNAGIRNMKVIEV